MELKAELEPVNRRAARSLQEGLEETLTLHRLGLFAALGRSLKTTNCIENLNGQVGRYIGKVERWHHSPQRHRCMALALLEAETRMRRLMGFRHLSKLEHTLKETLPDRERTLWRRTLLSLFQRGLHTCRLVADPTTSRCG